MPGELKGDAAAVARHYDRYAQVEAARLERYAPVEYAITLRYLERHAPPASTVVEIGVGFGHYSEFLARRGCHLFLIDIAQSLLRAAGDRLSAAGLASRIAGVHHASATALPIPDSATDVALLLGPLYHLRDSSERQQAVREAARVLRPGGIVFAGGINRLAFLRDALRAGSPSPVHSVPPPSPTFIAEYLATGNLDPQHAPPIGYAHLTTVAEFRELMSPHFEELALVGVESFTAPWQDLFLAKPEDERAAWLDIVATTGLTQEGLACSDHFLFIGRRP